MGGAPPEEGVSFRSYNRNFKGRSGTLTARVYLVNPLVAALMAIKGEVVDPLGYKFSLPRTFTGPAERQPDPFIQPPAQKPGFHKSGARTEHKTYSDSEAFKRLL